MKQQKKSTNGQSQSALSTTSDITETNFVKATRALGDALIEMSKEMTLLKNRVKELENEAKVTDVKLQMLKDRSIEEKVQTSFDSQKELENFIQSHKGEYGKYNITFKGYNVFTLYIGNEESLLFYPLWFSHDGMWYEEIIIDGCPIVFGCSTYIHEIKKWVRKEEYHEHQKNKY